MTTVAKAFRQRNSYNNSRKRYRRFPDSHQASFLKAVCAGTATMDQIRAWAIQDYQFRAAVPQMQCCAIWPATIRRSLKNFGVLWKKNPRHGHRQRRP